MQLRFLLTALPVAVLAVALAGCGATPNASGSPQQQGTKGMSHGSGASNGFSHESSGGPSHARSAPAQGGAAGTVGTVSASSFTLTTSAAAKVTVNETASTTFTKGTGSASASAITKGTTVLVLGTVSSTTIKATQVIVTPPGGASASSSAAKVIPFKGGTKGVSKQVGQIPANWSQGSGTIVGATVANQGTQAALAAYPGGIVDRVVKLSNGQYNVHYIGVNWPHHVFLSKNFKVVGAM